MIYPWDYCCRWRQDRMYQYGVKVIAQPSAEPITIEEARQHLRLDAYGSPLEHPDDALVMAQLSAAREWCEGDLGLSLAPQTLELGRTAWGTWDNWPYVSTETVTLPFGPVLGIASIVYLDGDGDEQTLDPTTYVLDNYSDPPRVSLVSGSWPTTSLVPNSVKIRYVTGYSLPGDSPQDAPLPWSLRAMILIVLGSLYENREQLTELKLMELPLGARALGDRYRARLGFA